MSGLSLADERELQYLNKNLFAYWLLTTKACTLSVKCLVTCTVRAG